MSEVEGVLVTCDVPVHELILHISKNSDDGEFVLDTLDDTHLFVRKDAVEKIQEAVASLMDNNFNQADEEGRRPGQRRKL